jgi:hypothetical protein
MTDEAADDLERRLRALRARLEREPRGEPPAPEDVWAFAAGELSGERRDEIARRIAADRGSLEELGRADDAFAAPVTPLAEREARADLVLGRVRVRPPRRRLLLLAAPVAAAAAVVLWVLFTLPPPAPVWEAQAVAETQRSPEEPPDAPLWSRLSARLTLEAPAHVVLLAAWHDGTGPRTARLFPPAVQVLDSPDYRDWPRNPLSGVVALPPPGAAAALRASARGAIAMILVSRRTPFTDSEIEGLRSRLSAGLPSGALDPEACERAAATLRTRGTRVEWRRVLPR